MKFLYCLVLGVALNQSAFATEVQFSADPLLKSLQLTVLGKFHGSEQGVLELRQRAISGLYDDKTRESSINVLMKLGLIMQDRLSCVALGDYFNDEEGELKQAAIYYTAAANLNDCKALFKLARIYLDPSNLNVQLAYEILVRGADLNDNYCLCALAQHHLDGTFQTADPLAALNLYKKSAENKFDLGITQYAALLNSTKVFAKADPVEAYENVLPIHTRDNRARIMVEELQRTASVKLYIDHHYLALAEAYASGTLLPLRRERAQIFLTKAYDSEQITKTEKWYYGKLIEQGSPWIKPSPLNIVTTYLF